MFASPRSFAVKLFWEDRAMLRNIAALTAIVAIAAQAAVYGMDIAEAKRLPDNSPVTLVGKVVTCARPGFFYIEEDSRFAGIRVEMQGHGLEAGMRADVSGTMKTTSGKERYIAAASAAQNGAGTVAPLAMNNSSVGGADWFYNPTTGAGQRGTSGTAGLNNIGLLVRVWGSFARLDATSFVLDDGSGLFIRCTAPDEVYLDSRWQHVSLTGISSMYKFNNVVYLPNILVRDAEGLPIVPTPCEMVFVPAGSFLMGNNGSEPYLHCEELPQHSVYLSGYWIGKYEVTRGEYRQFIDAGGYANPAFWSSEGWAWRVINGRTQPHLWDPVQDWGTGPFAQTDTHPVVGVSYYEAEAFCNWAGGHLPTEAQWEKAARWTGSYPNVYPWGNEWDGEKCNGREDQNPAGGGYQACQTAPVGSYPSGASPYGCQDMAGNVWEWVQDWYVSYPGCTPSVCLGCPSDYTGTLRVISGGSWGDAAFHCRCADRNLGFPSELNKCEGFRLARQSCIVTGVCHLPAWPLQRTEGPSPSSARETPVAACPCLQPRPDRTRDSSAGWRPFPTPARSRWTFP